ncbi:MAG: phospho-sugar mutase, partial [Clostridiales bacterium]|nr:phospho-sugar mutase [Clostridiales bacterium]
LLCEAACACMDRGETLYDALQRLYKKYGYFKETGISVTMPGKDGADKIKAIMADLQKNPPCCLGGKKVLAVRDFTRAIRIADGKEAPMDFPKANVLYFEIEGGNWVCIRPSGTEPKIKLYVATRAATPEENDAFNAQMAEAAKALLA